MLLNGAVWAAGRTVAEPDAAGAVVVPVEESGAVGADGADSPAARRADSSASCNDIRIAYIRQYPARLA